MTAQTTALALIDALTTGVSIDIPVVDLSDPIFDMPGDIDSQTYQTITRLEIEEITDGQILGEGAFDIFMRSAKAHLRAEYEADRITGAEYTKAYIEMMGLAMTNAVQFVNNREATFWASQEAQARTIIARATLEQQKADTAKSQIEANQAKAQYANAVLNLAITDIGHQKVSYELENVLPLQVQKLSEEVEAVRAQTNDVRSDGVTSVTGLIGRQKELYQQQITSYQRDAEVKAAKIFVDSWITQKTIDEGLTAPNAFTNASLDDVLTIVKENNGFTAPAP